jgi:PAS domain-containing protein
MFHRKVPLRDTNGNIVKWYGSSLDIEERKTAEVALRNSEAHLAEAQRLSRTGSLDGRFPVGEIFWSDETFRRDGDESRSIVVGASIRLPSKLELVPN